MKRRWKLGYWLVLLAVSVLLAPSRLAYAGGVVISLDSMPTDVQAGTPFTVGFVVRSMHDGRPIADLHPGPVFVATSGKQQLSFTAQSEGTPGHYSATITLPAAGTWNWEVRPFGEQDSEYPASILTPLVVQEQGKSMNAQPESASVLPSIASVLPLWVLFIIVAVAVGLAVLLRTRHKEVRS